MDKENTALLIKYLTGDCTPEERQVVQQLLEKEGSEELLNSLMDKLYLMKWEHPELLEDANPINEERLKSRLAMRVAGHSSSKIKKTPSFGLVRRKFRNWRNVAVWATVILISGIAIFQLKKTLIPSTQLAIIEQTNDGQQPECHRLPDKSIVYLGAGSTIRYAENYGIKDRELTLEGQAFFEVSPDQNRPFTVVTEEVSTTVLGTSFKVDAYKDKPLVVAVASGKVAVHYVANKQKEPLSILTPGKKITWDAATHKTVETEVDIYGLQQWAAGALVFDEQPLEIVFAEIEKRYHVGISLTDDSLRAYRVSGTFPSEAPLEQVLKILSRSGKFTYSATSKNNYQINKEKTKEDLMR